MEAGAGRIVVVRAITEASDPAAAAAALPAQRAGMPPDPDNPARSGPGVHDSEKIGLTLIFVSHHRLAPNVHEHTNALEAALSALRTELELPGPISG